jgi:DNA polymerase-3 subunit delta'
LEARQFLLSTSSTLKKSDPGNLSRLEGQPLAKRQLTAYLAAPGALFLLFTGPRGSGKRFAARLFAQAMVCDDPLRDGACGVCRSCKWFEKGVHFDVVEPEADAKGLIATAKIKDALRDLYALPRFGRHKVYLIDGDGLNEQGQNALLKSLETPPDYAAFLLTTSNESQLLPTVRSRAAVVPIGRRDDASIERILRLHGAEDAQEIARAVRFSEGLPGRALALLKDEEFPRLRKETAALFFGLPGRRRKDLLIADLNFLTTERARDAFALDDIFSILTSFIRDVMALDGAPCAPVGNDDYETELRGFAKALGKKTNARAALGRAASAVEECRRALAAYGSAETVLAELLLQLRKEFTLYD